MALTTVFFDVPTNEDIPYIKAIIEECNVEFFKDLGAKTGSEYLDTVDDSDETDEDDGDDRRVGGSGIKLFVDKVKLYLT